MLSYLARKTYESVTGLFSKEKPDAIVDAAEQNNTSKVKKLLESKADVNARQKDSANRESHDQTALFMACDRTREGDQSRIECINVLLEAKADTNFRCIYGTPLLSAVRGGNTTLIQVLLDSKANPNLKGTDNHLSPLISAAWSGKNSVVDILLRNGADPIIKYGYEETALDKAIEYKHTEIEKTITDFCNQKLNEEKKDDSQKSCRGGPP
jgi:ankyrin repeat protein